MASDEGLYVSSGLMTRREFSFQPSRGMVLVKERERAVERKGGLCTMTVQGSRGSTGALVLVGR